jgi:adenosine deaminase
LEHLSVPAIVLHLLCCCAGVFGTTLSQEYAIAAAAFHLSTEQLLDLAEQAVQHCFCSEQDKQLLLQCFARFKQQQQQQQQQPGG